MKIKIALILVLSAALVFASALFKPTYAKYAAKVNVGSVEIFVKAQQKHSHLDGTQINFFLRLFPVSEIVFDSYERHPEMRRMRGIDVGKYDDDATEADKIKMFYAENAFYVLSEKVISVDSTEGMFENCRYLERIKFDNFDTSNATSMKNMFYGCRSLTSLDISAFDSSRVTDMSAMFSGCSRLKTIYVSEKWSTENVLKGDNMFSGCIELTGENGTRYARNRISYVYARIDRPDAPGYLSARRLGVS